LRAAKILNIPTIYFQHASVSSSFPPLLFDLNLLEGQDSLDKYKAISTIKGAVELVGMPKFDHYLTRRKPKQQIHSVGIPYNFNDDIQMVVDLARSLRDEFPTLTITVRRHPKDKSQFSVVSEVPGVLESQPMKETAFDFLTKQDCIIAGNSSIHLEATLLNIPSVYFNFAPGTFIDDYYGYVRHELAYPVSSFNGLHEFIRQFNKSPRDVFPRAAYYNALVGRTEEGRSQEIVINEINAFIGQ
jgi:hypothetical protein